MPSNYPTSLDDLVGSQPYVDDVTVFAAAELNNIQDAIDNLQEKVGINSSGAPASHDYKLSHLMTPTTYAGEKSVTLSNGLIVKMDKAANVVQNGTVTFAVAFPNALIGISISPESNSGAWPSLFPVATPPSKTGFKTYNNDAETRDIWYIAIGY